MTLFSNFVKTFLIRSLKKLLFPGILASWLLIPVSRYHGLFFFFAKKQKYIIIGLSKCAFGSTYLNQNIKRFKPSTQEIGKIMSAKFTAVDAAGFLNVSLQAIHKHLKTKKLAFEKNQNRVYFSHLTSKSVFNLSFDPKIVAFQIVKGGTGKTSLAHAISVRANLYGARVLCIDLDQQANLTQALLVNSEELPVMVDILKDGINLESCIVNITQGLDLLPSRIENAILDNVIMLNRLPLDRVYKDRFIELKKQYDLIVIDCPPALGQSVAGVALSSDMIIAPVTPEEFSLSGLKISTEEIANIERTYKTRIMLKLVLNKFDTRTSLSHEVLSTLIKHPVFGEKLFKTYIRASQDFPNSITNGQSIFDAIRPTSAKEDVDLLTREILEISKSKTQEVSLGNLGKIT
jgi:chromosome partitioning protein